MIKKLQAARDEVLDELEDVGNQAADIIRKRTQLGYGVSEQGARKEKLKPLTDKYVKRRKSLSLGKTTPKKSNLTQSGHMLDDLHAKKTKEGTVEITFKSEEAQDKATWNTDKGRAFNNLSSSEIRQVKEIIQKKLEKILKKTS